MSKILKKTMLKHSKSLNLDEFRDLENILLETAQDSLQDFGLKEESEVFQPFKTAMKANQNIIMKKKK